MKKFKYDVMVLISCIRDRPCLWDKSMENYKDRLERREAWEQIFCILDEKYDEMTAEERRLMGEKVIYKWNNIRDTFMKSLKHKVGKPKRKYMLHDQLKFLKKNLPEGEYEEETTEESSYVNQDTEDIEVEEIPIKKESRQKHNDDSYINQDSEDTEVEEIPIKKKLRKKYNNDVLKSKEYGLRKRSKTKRHDNEEIFAPQSTFNGSEVDFVAVDGESRHMNEDEAFFASLLPTVVRYDVNDKLEFRMGVLEVMKRINDSKKWAMHDE